MQLVHDPALDEHYPERYTSIVELALRDGRMVARRVDYAKGTRENPLTPDEVRAKYFRLTAPIVPRRHAAAIMAEVDRLERARDLGPLASLLRRAPGRVPESAGHGPTRNRRRTR
jgi:2-methylcitrate dehydratase PrpD